MRLLLLEDDQRQRAAYARRLRTDGHAVDEFGTIAEARKALIDAEYDCLVLDRRVPDGDALRIVAELEGHARRPQVLVFSALGDTDQRLLGLEHGADDYVPKPVRLDELALRVRKLAVRATTLAPTRTRLGRVVLDHARGEVFLDDELVRLTPMQYAVFEYLASHRDRLVPTEELVDHCWDRHRHTFGNPVHTQITRLRKCFHGALEFPVVRGVGYVVRVVEPT